MTKKEKIIADLKEIVDFLWEEEYRDEAEKCGVLIRQLSKKFESEASVRRVLKEYRKETE